MKYTLQRTASFKKDYKLIKKRGYDMNKLVTVVSLLANAQALPAVYSDHALTGN